MSFDYTITADASKALAETQKVVVKLEDVEKAAEHAGAAMASQLLRASQRAKELDDALAGAKIGSAFEGLADHFRREADALERIRGPAKDHAADIRAIQTLYQRGAISGAEFSAEVERLNAALAKTPEGGLASKIGGGLMEGSGASALLAGGAAGIAATAAQTAVTAISHIGGMADAYTNLDNRLRKVTADEETRAALMQRTKQIANDSRAEWATTGELFVRLSSATKDMNLGQERTLKLTETITKAFAMSGASTEEQAGSMLQLSQAFASGRLQGDEFRSISEAMPDIMDRIAATMHVTRGELKQLGSDGKITSDILVKSFEESSKQIDSDFAKTAPTLAQSWTVFKNEMMDVAAKLVRETDLLPTVAGAFKDLAGAISAVAEAYRAVKAARDALGISGTGGSQASESGIGEKLPGLGAGGIPGASRVDPFGFSGIPGAIKNIGNSGSDEEQRRAAELFNTVLNDQNKTVGDLRNTLVAKAEATRIAATIDGEASQKINEITSEIRSQMTPATEEQTARWAAGVATATTANDTLETYYQRVVAVADVVRSQWAPATEQQKKDFEEVTKSVTDGTSAWGDFVDKSDKADTPHKNMLRLLDAGKQLVKTFENLGDVASNAIQTFEPSGADALVDAIHDMFTSYQGIKNLNAQNRDTTEEIVAEVEKWDDAIDRVKGSANVILTDFQQTINVLPDLIRKGAEYIALKKGDPWAADPSKHHVLSIEEKLLQDILGPMKLYKQEVAALDDLLRRHLITTAQYNVELDKVSAKLGGIAKMLAEVQAHEREISARVAGPHGADVTGALNDVLENPQFFDPNARDRDARHTIALEQELEDAQRKAAADRQNDLGKDQAETQKVFEATQKWRVELEKVGKSHDILDGVKKGLDDVYKEATDVSATATQTITDTFHGLEDTLVNAAMTGKLSWNSFLSTLEKDLAKLALRILEMRALMAIFGADAGPGPTVGAAEAMTYLNGGGHASGGSYTVPGSGGPDSARVMFALTPGERVDFTPPGAASAARGVTINNVVDPRALARALSSTPEGRQAIHNVIASDPAAFRQALRK